MNRYQQEVAEIDRRYAVMVRAVCLVGTAALVAIALWSAGISPSQLWADVHRWSGRNSGEELPAAIANPTPMTALPTSAASTTRDSAGTDSLIAPRPQQLYLMATTPGNNKHEGTARIGTSPNTPQTYIAGALLVNGARIAEIHRDHVVLERRDERGKLYLHAAQTERRADALAMLSSDSPVPPLPPVTREVLTDYLRPSPVFENDTLRGYQVYPGRKAGVFSQLGLRPGDVITAINDAPILEAATAISALKEITNGTSVIVGIERNGKSERLVLDSTLITADLERDIDSAAARPVAGPPGA